ncbi:MAG: UDP-N-acetylmuramate dehydrogenase [Candidatus Sericytochromatia bacterium]|nr:UDP-N-acetylmuramate dehydrogenase [Candidatus Sericytochromatia bacterium]
MTTTAAAGITLAQLTTWRVGGPVRRLIESSDATLLAREVSDSLERGHPWTVLGKGSNILAADEGFDGTILRLQDDPRAVKVSGNEVHAPAGLANGLVVKAAMTAGLGGLAFLSSIPGTLGGAVFMNAGAHGVQTHEVLARALVLRPGYSPEWWPPEAFGFGYRHSCLQHQQALVLEVVLRGRPAPPQETRAEIQALAAWRRARQPQEPSAGSVFRNPEGTSAGHLIEAAGLKGLRIGDACVSPMHANFIVNCGHATARDMNKLIATVRARVHETHGLWLHPEVRGLGVEVGRP